MRSRNDVRYMDAVPIIPGRKNMLNLQTAGASERENVNLELPKSSGLIGSARRQEATEKYR
jgi:hypothetical protein